MMHVGHDSGVINYRTSVLFADRDEIHAYKEQGIRVIDV